MWVQKTGDDMSEKVPDCWIHKIPMIKSLQKSHIFKDTKIPVWKCPQCDYMEYRNEEEN